MDAPDGAVGWVAARSFVRLLQDLHRDLRFSMVMITHDLSLLRALCDRIAVLADARLAALGTFGEILRCGHPFVQQFFNGEPASQLEANVGGAARP